MAYAELDNPLPGLTVSPNGCRSCGMRGYGCHDCGLGQDVSTIDTTSTTDFGSLIPPSESIGPIISPDTPVLTPGPLQPTDLTNAPVAVISPVLPTGSEPSTIGTNFIDVGGGNYLNLQTGQTVPQATAEAITAASTGPATANLSTVSTTGSVTLIDPTSGVSTTVATNNLTTAAQALQAAGQLVDATGKLTAQGQALAAAGNLYNAPPSTGVNLSAAMSSLTTWFNQSTLVSGVPNWGVLAGGVAGLAVFSAIISRPKRRRR